MSARAALLTMVLLSTLGISCGRGAPPPATGAAPTAPSAVAPRVDLRSAGFSLMPQASHPNSVSGAGLSADGRVLVTGGDDGSLRVWDTRAGLMTHALEPHKGRVSTVIVLDGGRRALTGSGDRARLHDLSTGRPLRAFPAAAGRLAPLGDGSRFVSISRGGGVKLFSLESDKVVRRLRHDHFDERGDAAKSEPVALRGFRASRGWSSPDGKRLALYGLNRGPTGRTQEQLCILDVEGGAVRHVIDLPEHPHEEEEEHDLDVAWPSADRLFTLERDGALSTWELGDAEAPRRTRTLQTGAGASLLSADGRTVARTGAGRRVQIVEVTSGKVLATWTGDGESRPWPIAFQGPRIVISEGFMGGRSPRVSILDAASTAAARFDGIVEAVHAASFTPDGRTALIGTGSRVMAWDLDTGAPRQVMSTSGGGYAKAFSPDGTVVAVATEEGIELWPIRGGSPRKYPGPSGDVVFSKDGKRMLVGARAGSAEGARAGAVLWDVDGARLVRRFATAQATVHVAMSADASTIALGANDAVETWEVGSSLPKGRIRAEFVYAVGITPTAEQLVVGGVEEGAGSWLTLPGADGKQDRSIEIPGAIIVPHCIAFAPNGRRALVGDLGGQLTALDLDARTALAVTPAHTGPTYAIAHSPDGRLVLSGGADGARLSVGADGPSIRLLFAGDEWLLQSDEGYFDASRRGADLAAIAREGRAYHVDQAGALLNRPDLVLARVGLGKPEISAHFLARYERRLKKLGLDASQLSAALASGPEARIRDAVRTGSRATLDLELSARGAPLLRFEVFVNGVPVFGSAGRPTSGTKQSVSEEVELSAGRNVIEVAVTDRAGIGSLRDTRVLDGAPEVVGDLYFVGFGVSKYRDRRLDLDFAHKDVLDLARVFEDMRNSRNGFAQVHVHPFIDQQVTVERIREARAMLAGAKVDDTVVVAVTGHGVHTRDAAATYFYVTHETDVKRVAQTAAPFELLEGLLDGIRPRRKLLLLDTCESGDDDGAPAPGLHARGARALLLVDDHAEGSSAGSGRAPATSWPAVDRERLIEGDLTRRTGAIVFSSSRSSERSYESPRDQNGAFTKEVLAALTSSVADANGDGFVSTEELRRYVAAAVPQRTQDRQHPTVDRDNLGAVFRFPLAAPAGAKAHSRE